MKTKGVLIVGETSGGKLDPVTPNLLGMGRKLADDLGQELCAVLINSDLGDAANETIFFGATKVYTIENQLFEDYAEDFCVAALEKLNAETSPEILLLGHTPIGRDVAPRLAFRLKTGVTLDCVDVSINTDTGLLQKTKPVYGGKALAVYVNEGRPQMAAIRINTMEALARDTSRKGEIVKFDPGVDESSLKAKVTDKIKEKVFGIKLEDAEVIVCGGRGVGSAEAFHQLEDLAGIFKGSIASTKPPCDFGWISSFYQIGLTGKFVSPDLYIGIAVSGALQHYAGMSLSKNIVAINKDPEAQIFTFAHYGVIGDYKKVLPAFIEKCREIVV